MSWTRYDAAGNISKPWEKISHSKPQTDMKALQKVCEDSAAKLE